MEAAAETAPETSPDAGATDTMQPDVGKDVGSPTAPLDDGCSAASPGNPSPLPFVTLLFVLAYIFVQARRKGSRPHAGDHPPKAKNMVLNE